MPKLGPPLWDDPTHVLGTVDPRGRGFNLGSAQNPFKAIYTEEGITVIAAVNGRAGTVTLDGATPVAVANTSITTNSVVQFSLKTVGGTVGAIPTVKTITPGTGFTVAGTAADTSTYNYVVTEIG